MKSKQFSHRIGNIEDALVEQAGNVPSYRRERHNRNLRRVASMAAILLLMVGSFAAGAIALTKEPEIVYVESDPEIVYVEKEQEIITVGDSGISLILPDEWAGKYGYELNGNNVSVYHLATHEAFELGGVLFWIECLEGQYPMDYVYPEPGFTIAITETSTYRFTYPSDIQVDVSEPESQAEYDKLSAGIATIEIVMTAEMLANTTNATNWVQGTVYVSFLEDSAVTKTVDCDAEQSRIIRKIIESQEFGQPGSFPTDLLIMMSGDEYYLNSATGDIMMASGGYSAVLSTGDLDAIIRLLNSVKQ